MNLDYNDLDFDEIYTNPSKEQETARSRSKSNILDIRASSIRESMEIKRT